MRKLVVLRTRCQVVIEQKSSYAITDIKFIKNDYPKYNSTEGKVNK